MSGHIVIIGGGGFIGTALAQALVAQGRQVLVLDRAHRLTRSAHLLGDVETAVFEFPNTHGISAHLTGAAALVHLTCTSTPSSSMQSLHRDAEENIAPSVALFEAAGTAGVSKVLFASSGGTVYGDTDHFPISEDTTLAPLSGYGASKVAIETYLQLAARRDGFCGVSMRIANPYGAYQLSGAPVGVMAHYLSAIFANTEISVWGDGEIIRDYIHISDTIAAITALLDQENLTSGAYNIGSSQGVSINQIISSLFKATGKSTPVCHTPPRGFDVQRIILDTQKIHAATGWAPKVSLEAGIALLWHDLQEGTKPA